MGGRVRGERWECRKIWGAQQAARRSISNGDRSCPYQGDAVKEVSLRHVAAANRQGFEHGVRTQLPLIPLRQSLRSKITAQGQRTRDQLQLVLTA